MRHLGHIYVLRRRSEKRPNLCCRAYDNGCLECAVLTKSAAVNLKRTNWGSGASQTLLSAVPAPLAPRMHSSLWSRRPPSSIGHDHATKTTLQTWAGGVNKPAHDAAMTSPTATISTCPAYVRSRQHAMSLRLRCKLLQTLEPTT